MAGGDGSNTAENDAFLPFSDDEISGHLTTT